MNKLRKIKKSNFIREKNSSLKSKFRTFLKKIRNLNFLEENFCYFYNFYLKKINAKFSKKVFKKKKVSRSTSRVNCFLKKNYFNFLIKKK